MIEGRTTAVDSTYGKAKVQRILRNSQTEFDGAANRVKLAFIEILQCFRIKINCAITVATAGLYLV
eukprot:gene7093-14429_t